MSNEQYGDLDYDAWVRIGDPEDRKSARRVIIDKTFDEDGDQQEIYSDGAALVTNRGLIAELKLTNKYLRAVLKHLEIATDEEFLEKEVF